VGGLSGIPSVIAVIGQVGQRYADSIRVGVYRLECLESRSVRIANSNTRMPRLRERHHAVDVDVEPADSCAADD